MHGATIKIVSNMFWKCDSTNYTPDTVTNSTNYTLDKVTNELAVPKAYRFHTIPLEATLY